MNVRIYQRNTNPEAERRQKQFGYSVERIDPTAVLSADYHLAYETTSVVDTLDELFFRCNDGQIAIPSHKMSISDIVEVSGCEKIPAGCYFCDTDKWVKLNTFLPSLTSQG